MRGWALRSRQVCQVACELLRMVGTTCALCCFLTPPSIHLPPASPMRLPPQVPQLRTRLLARSPAEWDSLAQRQAAEQFGAAAAALSKERLGRMLRSFELMCGMEEQEGSARQRQVRGCLHGRL